MPLPESDAHILASWKPNLLKISNDATNIANHLWAEEILQQPHIDIIKSQSVHGDKMIQLINIYGQRALNLDPLKRALQELGQESVMNESNLAALAYEDMVNNIKARLQYMCENVAKVWGRLLAETSLDMCFVKPEIVEYVTDEIGEKKKKKTGKAVNNYKQLFECQSLGDRIVIEGDPGMGKTTYVNKLALDWTWEKRQKQYSKMSRFLQTTFSVVFLIPLRSLNGGKSATLAQAAETQLRNCGQWLSTEYQRNPTKCLLILDAFDEYDGSCREINEIIEGQLFPRLKVIVTTRPSHIERLATKNHLVWITGLTTIEKREQFLQKQGWKKFKKGVVISHILSGFGSLWHAPLYLAMLCVLYKAKKVTNFDPLHPNCFHVLVKLFTEHIMSRCVKEKGLELEGKRKLKLKLFLQQYALQQFCENNSWFNDVLKESHLELDVQTNTSCLQDHAKLAGEIGLIIIHEEQSPINGENIEIASFIHQMFLEYYAAIEFAPIFTNCNSEYKNHLAEGIENCGFLPDLEEKNENKEMTYEEIDDTDSEFRPNFEEETEDFGPTTVSPFSYFLAAECMSYKETLVNSRNGLASSSGNSCIVIIPNFPWLPEIAVSKDIFNKVPNVSKKELSVHCSDEYDQDINSFWEICYVKEVQSIAQAEKLTIISGSLGFHHDHLDSILSSVSKLKVGDCNCDHINLPPDKVYPNMTEFVIKEDNEPLFPKESLNDEMLRATGELVLLKHFTNLNTLEIDYNYRFVPNTDQIIGLLCDSLSKMKRLETLILSDCLKSPQSVIRLAKTIEKSSLHNSLKKLDLTKSKLDTEKKCATEILFKSISKCVQLEELYLYNCQIKHQSLVIIKAILNKSANLKNSMKQLELVDKDLFDHFPQTIEGISEKEIKKWEKEVRLILPHCTRDSDLVESDTSTEFSYSDDSNSGDDFNYM